MADPKDLADRVKLINDRANAELRLNDILGKRSDLVATEAKFFAEQRQQLERQITLLNDRVAAQKELDEMSVKEQEKNKDRVKNLELLVNMTKDQREAEIQRLQVMLQVVNAQEKQRTAGQAISKNLLSSLDITGKWRSTTMGLAIEAKKAGNSFGQIAKQTMRATFTMDNLDNLIGSTLMKVTDSTIKLALAVDSAMSAFNRTFGAAGRLNSEFFELSINATKAGLTFVENMEVLTSLSNTVDMFLVSSESTRQSLLETAQMMHLFGVESQTSGELFNLLAKSLGESTSQIQQTATGIMEFALSIGEAPDKMVQSFTKLIPEFVRYGTRAKDVFGAVAKQAKALGTEIETLIGISQKFDTFEDAGTTAGKLMGILGQPVDVMGLMEMDPEEKIRSIIGMIEQSGMQAEILNNKFGLLAMGDVLGVSAAEAAKLVRIGVAGYDEQLAKQKEVAIEEEMRQKQLIAAQDLMKKIQQTIQEFALENEDMIMGVVEGMKSFLQIIINVAGTLKGAFIPAIFLLMGGLKLLAMRYHANAIAAAISGNAAIEAGEKTKEGAGKVGIGAAKMAAGLFGVAAVILAVGAAIYFATTGIGSMVQAMRGLTGEEVQNMAILLGVVTASILLLAGGMLLMAKAGTIGLVGFIAMAAGLAAVGLALMLIKTEDLIAVGNVFAGLGALAMAGGAFTDVGKGMDIVVDRIDDMDSDKVDKLGKAMKQRANASFSPFGGVGGAGGEREVVLNINLTDGDKRALRGTIRGLMDSPTAR